MVRLAPIALLFVLSLSGATRGGDGEHCGRCGCKLHCQVKCEWATCKVLRYKATHTECPAPCDECCDDRWILGCCKPIKIMSLKPYEETKKYLVRKYVVRTCLQCQKQRSAPAEAAVQEATLRP